MTINISEKWRTISSNKLFSIKSFFTLLCTCAFMGSAYAQTCASPGKDGPCNLSGIVNTYHSGVAGTVAAGATVVPLASVIGQRTNTRALQAGDLVLVMQMQDSANGANAGLHEYATIISIAGNSITLNRPLTNTYVQDVGNAPIRVRTYQVIYVPQCASATVAAANTVSADRWTINTANGHGTGGVVAFDVAGSLAINGTVTVAGAGFRGGMGINGSANRAGGLFNDANYAFDIAAVNGALKGEGTLGTPMHVFDGTATPVVYSALVGQGYAAGAAGQGAQGNAGGGANDGSPTNQFNGTNSGGGGGGNAGSGGQGGNSWINNSASGGQGGLLQTNTAARMVMGGGGGGGTTNNNTGANSVSTWPPIVDATTRPLPPARGTANGAAGAVSSSGASGGGVVLIRTGVLLPSTGNVNADGYTAYNTNGGSDSAGGGGAGGSIYFSAASGSAGTLGLSARGGGGGYSNYTQHGPGGGGGGGFIQTSALGFITNVSGGAAGFDACCGGPGAPINYGAGAGSGAVAVVPAAAATGNSPGSQCLPVLSVTKTTNTPLVTLPAQSTAQYIISVSNANTAGTAYGVSLQDILPSPFGLQASNSTATAIFSGTLTNGPAPSASNQSGNTATANFGVSGGTNTNSFTIGSGGVVTISFVVNVNTTTVPQTFQNSASTTFTDPTRAAGGTAAAGGNPTVSPGATYTSGVSVAGSNYLSSSSTGEDVRLVGSVNIAISKTNGTTTLISGQTTSYTVTVSNVSPTLGVIGAVVQDTATPGLSCSTATCTNNGTAALCPAPYNPGPAPFATLNSGLSIPLLPTNSSLSFSVVCSVTATGL